MVSESGTPKVSLCTKFPFISSVTCPQTVTCREKKGGFAENAGVSASTATGCYSCLGLALAGPEPQAPHRGVVLLTSPQVGGHVL